MSIRNTDFKTANEISDPAKIQTHIVVVDWHTTPEMSSSQSTAFRFQFRDACLRYLDSLFQHFSVLPKNPRLLLLIVEPRVVDPQKDDSVRLAVVTETAALVSIRNRTPAASVIRRTAHPPHPAVVDANSHACLLSKAIYQWGEFAHLQIITCKSIAVALQKINLPGVDFHPNALKETIAALFESKITLAVGAASPLTLCARPRVIPRPWIPNPPSWLAATTRVASDSVHEDVMTGPSFVLWTKCPESLKIMEILCERLRKCKQFLLCVGHTDTYPVVAVIVPPRHGTIALLREVAHQETLLPIPCRCPTYKLPMSTMTVTADKSNPLLSKESKLTCTFPKQSDFLDIVSDSSDEETVVGLTLLPQQEYDADQVCTGKRIEALAGSRSEMLKGGNLATNSVGLGGGHEKDRGSQSGERIVNFEVVP